MTVSKVDNDVNPCLTAALEAYEAGLCVMPPREDGTKAPLAPKGEWKHFQMERATIPQIEKWYSTGRTGMGIITGRVSGNVELFDFDDEDVYHAFKEAADEVGLSDVVTRIEAGCLECSPKPGFHWLTRCDEIGGSTKLACRPDPTPDNPNRVKTLIETKGEGGYAITAPSRGTVHPTGQPYVLISGGFGTITTITPEERRDLWNLARIFDQMPKRGQEPQSHEPKNENGGIKPGADFNARASWHQVLNPAGWYLVYERGGTEYWRRPGKDRGVSATTNHAGSGLFYVFSTSTEFEAECGYSKFRAYAILNYDGDFKAAAKALARQGYGVRVPTGGGYYEGTTGNTSDENNTDMGNGRRLVARHGDDLRYCWPWKKWLVWDGRAWQKDDTAEVIRRAKDTVRAIYREAADCPDPDRRDALSKWANKSEAENRIDAMISLARSEPGIPVVPADLDSDNMLFNCQNGTLDLRNGVFRKHRKSDLITRCVPIVFDSKATCPLWDSFLDRIMSGNQGMIQFLQRCAGLSLTGDASEHILLILYGTGANGKSVFFTVLLAVTGPYGKKAAPDLLLVKRHETHPTELADLMGVRALVTNETDVGRRLAEAKIKDLTGGDRIKARYLFTDFFEFDPTHKVWMATNHKPIIRGMDRGIWRRIRLIPFTVTIPDNEQDKHLSEKLKTELPGILNWAIKGCLLWQKNGLDVPEEVKKATDLYKTEMDTMQVFIDDRCMINPLAKVRSSQLHKRFLDWCEAEGEKMMNQKEFSKSMEERGFEKKRDTSGWWFLGIGLIQEEKYSNARTG